MKETNNNLNGEKDPDKLKGLKKIKEQLQKAIKLAKQYKRLKEKTKDAGRQTQQQ